MILYRRSQNLPILELKFYTHQFAVPYVLSPLSPGYTMFSLFHEFDYFRFLTLVESCSICPLVTGVFHLT